MIKYLKVSAGILSFLAAAALPAMAQEAPEDYDLLDEEAELMLVSVPQTPSFQVPVLEVSDSDTAQPPIAFEPSGMTLAVRGGGGPGGEGGPGGGWKGGKCGGGGGGCLSGENALTDEQREQIYDLKNKMLDELGPKMAAYGSAKRHLRDVLTQETIDSSQADKLQKQIIALKSDMETLKLSNRTEMAKVLTGSQRKALRQAMMKFGGGHKHRHHFRRGHH